MNATLFAFAYLSLLATGAIFGFFYAWVCSTMWGLDAADPSAAIAAAAPPPERRPVHSRRRPR